jgi:hypothetical protein
MMILAAATLSQNRTGNRQPGTTARIRGEQFHVSTGRIARHPRRALFVYLSYTVISRL